MAMYVRFESKEDLELLTRLVENTVERLRTNTSTFVDIAEPMHRVVDSLHSAAPVSDGHLIGVPTDVVQADTIKEKEANAAKAAARKANGKGTTKNLALCPTHKTYQAKQVPRQDCDGCWTAYKRFNPDKYVNARRSFERKQQKQA